MAGLSGSQRVVFIVLRHMRTPILVLILVYTTSMVGWAMILGADLGEGRQPMSFFHAFYFLTYTATTTGFGEIPQPFTEAQRMWAMISLYAGVVAWLYAIGAIIQLIQNPHFHRALAARRFAKTVARLVDPFVILCGFGNTGSLLTRGLSDAGVAVVILDSNPDRINAVYLRDYRVPTPTLCADSREPGHLVEAGLTRPNCQAVIALTSDEDVNVKISVSARLLNPKVQVITRSTQDIHDETLATLGRGVHIIDPFQTYARYLGATIHDPLIHRLNEWLVGVPGASLTRHPKLPRESWILCGFGRMGRSMRAAFEELGISTVVIDPNIDAREATACSILRGRASQRMLCEAGIEHVCGIVAGTNRDSDNLSIVLNARALNPNIFVVVRQNQHRNEVLFNAAAADLIMQPNLVSARRILFLLIAPLLKSFFDRIRECALRDQRAFIHQAVHELQERVGGTRPRLWTVRIARDGTAALAAGRSKAERR